MAFWKQQTVTGPTSEIEDAVVRLLRERAVPTIRVAGGNWGAVVKADALEAAVEREVGRQDEVRAQLDQAVKRLGGKRTNYADAMGYLWRLRRLFGRSAERPADVYAFPPSVAPPYEHPYVKE
jgi:hypothetical protein